MTPEIDFDEINTSHSTNCYGFLLLSSLIFILISIFFNINDYSKLCDEYNGNYSSMKKKIVEDIKIRILPILFPTKVVILIILQTQFITYFLPMFTFVIALFKF